MADDQETYKNLKTNPTESTTSKVNKFVDYNRLDVEKIAKELAVYWNFRCCNTTAMWIIYITQRKYAPTIINFFNKLAKSQSCLATKTAYSN